jgi:2-methylcitrate dehydratase
MARVHEMAAFVARAGWDDLSQAARGAMSLRVLDSLGCALGALAEEGEGPARLVREHVLAFGGAERCSLAGGGRSSPDRAAFHNAALVRYLDFNDSYLAPGETCHPSDALGAVLAAAEDAGRSGRELLVALAIAYQVQCRLSDVAPLRARGFDHVTHLAWAVAAGVSKALGLDPRRTANALAIAGTAFNALRVTRTGELSQWKGLAAPNAAFAATHASYLAARGITGPPEVIEGEKGFERVLAAGPLETDWKREDLERVLSTSVKRFDAEIHSQSVLEAAMELRGAPGFDPAHIGRVEVEVFQVAYDIIGGGEEGAKHQVRTKEQADHSLPYLVAVLLLDGEVMPEQYAPERIAREDVQALLRRVQVRPDAQLSERFPREMPCRVSVVLEGGRRLVAERSDFEGFPVRPAGRETVLAKFRALAEPVAGAALAQEIADCALDLEKRTARELAELLERVPAGRERAAGAGATR